MTFLKPGQSVLEIGAGAGWQAKQLADQQMRVSAIDVADSNYNAQRTYPVTVYDGQHIPFDDHTFDVIFSSNTLEHIPHIRAFQTEMQRVLKPTGLAIHLMPTTSWRFWTSLTGYAYLLQVIGRKLFRQKAVNGTIATDNTQSPNSTARPGFLMRLRRLLLPNRHGEFGNALSELYYFSRARWVRLFRETGWCVQAVIPNHLFYTGYSIFDERLSLPARRRFSYVLGSACLIYVLRPTESTPGSESQP